MDNRQIKFRAWDTTDNKMHGDVEAKFWLSNGFDALTPCEIHFMQFTGFTDIKGKDIYEGDIVKTIWVSDPPDEDEGIIEKAEIVFASGCFWYEEDDQLLHEMVNSCEVIGNIYEHPELLNS